MQTQAENEEIYCVFLVIKNLLTTENLSERVNPQKLIEAKIPGLILNYLTPKTTLRFQREATWILSCIAYSQNENHVQILVEAGVIPLIIPLLQSTCYNTQENVFNFNIYSIVCIDSWKHSFHK